ncbi:right-handed parallel beta-helix repeat-containing protein [Bartonella schoenbuchensis]|uniref:Right handed beta helix domain-containing protein n=1 Tax=Bartonella schoenbuchensis (strain DSM 13525 / NCTC 13165 / R1) TaxID=687861 RepID=A0A1S6XRM5_BARSR|nr:right-handed parallel beta-helix repeat-containing protein [Bartonella schoenbuchensis]AQX31205.1 hypothetical protein BscR1v2_012910 [Bartonella schoenbuchensis R1]
MGIAMSSGWLTVKDGTKIEFMGDYGVYMGSGVKSASLTGTVIRGNGKGKGTGVYAKGGTNLTMTLDKVEIKGVEMGVYMEKEGKSLTISGSSTISFMGDYGVYMGNGVTSAELNDVTITGKNKGMGIHAMGGRT